jgi:hypothetical protein
MKIKPNAAASQTHLLISDIPFSYSQKPVRKLSHRPWKVKQAWEPLLSGEGSHALQRIT